MFNVRLKELREYHGFSQKDLSEMTGIPHYTITKYENNARRPDYANLKELARVFNTSIDYLFGYSDFVLDDFEFGYFEEMLNANSKKIKRHIKERMKYQIPQIRENVLPKRENRKLIENAHLMIFASLYPLFIEEESSFEILTESEKSDYYKKVCYISDTAVSLVEVANNSGVTELERFSKIAQKSANLTYSLLSDIDLESKPEEQSLMNAKSYVKKAIEDNKKLLSILESLEDID